MDEKDEYQSDKNSSQETTDFLTQEENEEKQWLVKNNDGKFPRRVSGCVLDRQKTNGNHQQQRNDKRTSE